MEDFVLKVVKVKGDRGPEGDSTKAVRDCNRVAGPS